MCCIAETCPVMCANRDRQRRKEKGERVKERKKGDEQRNRAISESNFAKTRSSAETDGRSLPSFRGVTEELERRFPPPSYHSVCACLTQGTGITFYTSFQEIVNKFLTKCKDYVFAREQEKKVTKKETVLPCTMSTPSFSLISAGSVGTSASECHWVSTWSASQLPTSLTAQTDSFSCPPLTATAATGAALPFSLSHGRLHPASL